MLTLTRTWFNLHLRLSGTPTPELCRRSCPACRSGTSVSAPATNAGRQAGRHVCKPNQVDDGKTSRRRQDISTTARSVKGAGASQTGEAPPRKGDRSPVLGHIYRQPRSCQPEPQKTEPPTTRNKHLHSSANSLFTPITVGQTNPIKTVIAHYLCVDLVKLWYLCTAAVSPTLQSKKKTKQQL